MTSVGVVRDTPWMGKLVGSVIALMLVFTAVGYGASRLVEDQPSVGPQVTREPPPDADGDGLSDRDEEIGWSSGDGDIFRTEPNSADSDHDGLNDSGEADAGTNPLRGDTDSDGLDDRVEIESVGTDPLNRDTDDDGFNDREEDDLRIEQGLDPLVKDTRVSRRSYATDFAIGSVAGDVWRKDSFAWFVGNLASSGSSSIPLIGWVVGPLADARDLVASVIRGDWVSSGFSAASLVPYIGDAAAVPGKVGAFLARNPELATKAAFAVMTIEKLPTKIKVRTSKQIWSRWGDLRTGGAGEKGLLRLQQGRLDLDRLGEAVKRSNHVPARVPAKFFADGPAGEKYLEVQLSRSAVSVNSQVVASTKGCIEICNASFRRFDVVADGVAHESKVGFKVFSTPLARQIQSDAFLVKTGVVDGAHWDFFPSDRTSQLGAHPKVLDLLDEAGITYTIHLPK